jgi:hypothetical protein
VAGLVGIGFSSPATPVDCRTSGRPGYLLVTSDTGTSNQYAFSNGSNFHAGVVGTVTGNTTNSGDVFGLGYAASVVNDDFTPVLTWTANTNRVGIGTQTPALKLSVDGDLWNGNGFGAEVGRLFNDPGGVYHLLASSNMAGLAFGTNGTEKARIDNSGRLLVGTSNARSNFFNGTLSAIFQVEGANAGNNRNSSFVYGQSNASGPIINLGKHRSDSVGGITVVAADDQIGSIAFQGSDGTDFVAGAQISAFVDGTPGADDMPGRLVFSTTADGAASPTERLRITSAGVLQVADAGNIAVGTTTGTKIGTATTQKLGFFNKTPVVQPAAVADATDAASVITQLNALLARMRDLGLIAT